MEHLLIASVFQSCFINCVYLEPLANMTVDKVFICLVGYDHKQMYITYLTLYSV